MIDLIAALALITAVATFTANSASARLIMLPINQTNMTSASSGNRDNNTAIDTGNTSSPSTVSPGPSPSTGSPSSPSTVSPAPGPSTGSEGSGPSGATVLYQI